MIWLAFLLLVLGLVILVKGSDFLVDGAAAIAKKFNIPPIVIGLTIIAFGTSAPELLVALISSSQGATDLALGNIFGSNIANILLILGVVAWMKPIKISRSTIWKEIPLTLLGALVVTVLGLRDQIDKLDFSSLALNSTETINYLGISSGIVLLFFFIIFVYYTFSIARNSTEEIDEIKDYSISTSILVTILGIIFLGVGSKLFVDSAINIAEYFGVSQGFIGLTLVALGTSLPELVASIAAAKKNQAQMAVGNVIGSNIYNIFFVLGIASLFNPIPLTGQNLADILFLLAATAFLFIISFVSSRKKIARTEGFIMLWAYSMYLIYIYLR